MEAHEPFNCIHTVPIFRDLNEAEMDSIYDIAHSKKYSKGTTVYEAGDQEDSLIVVYTGKIKISRINQNGKEQVIRVIGHGDFMGELSLFSAIEMKETSQVLEDAVVCVIQAEDFKQIMKDHASIALKVLDVMSRRLEKAENLIESINLNTTDQRTASALIDLMQGQKQIDLPMNKGHLASQLGMSQESLSRSLGALKDAGIIETKGHKKIIILDQELLESIGSGEDM